MRALTSGEYRGNEATAECGFLIPLITWRLGIDGHNFASVLFNITDAAPLIGIILSIICSVLVYALSYPLTVSIYKKKEY